LTAEGRRSLLLWSAIGVVVAAVVIIGVIVLGGDDSAEACGTPEAAPASEIALMPEGMSFDQIGTVTSVQKDGDNIDLQAVTTKQLDEVTVLIQDAVTAAGYDPAGMDNEGDEAEVFFQAGTLAAGQAVVRETSCEGRWHIDLVLLDRAN
jgi:hypothetical protein